MPGRQMIPNNGASPKRRKKTTSPIMTIFWHLNMTNNKTPSRSFWIAASAAEVLHLSCDEIRVMRNVFRFDPASSAALRIAKVFGACNHISKSHVHMRVRFVGGRKTAV